MGAFPPGLITTDLISQTNALTITPLTRTVSHILSFKNSTSLNAVFRHFHELEALCLFFVLISLVGEVTAGEIIRKKN